MFRKVMWATDGSEAADRALPVAKTLALDSSGELLVVHCEEVTTPYRTGGAYSAHPNEDELKAKIERQVAELSTEGVSAALQTTIIPVGGAAHAITDTAIDSGTEVIVVGTRGHTPVGGLLLGSVAQRLLQIAPCPVLVVPATGQTSG
jgi:nucleotide-binding universal stress UspA family protein